MRAAWAGLEPARTCFKDRRATDYSNTHRSLEAGHDPAPPAWKASTLPAYATPSCLRSGRHDSNVHEPSDSTLLGRLRLPISPRPDSSDDWSRRRDSNARPLTYQVSALTSAELRRLGWGCRRQDSNLQCAEARHVLGVVRLPVSPRRQGSPCRIPTDGLLDEGQACWSATPTGDADRCPGRRMPAQGKRFIESKPRQPRSEFARGLIAVEVCEGAEIRAARLQSNPEHQTSDQEDHP